jgi:hypothetical protein
LIGHFLVPNDLNEDLYELLHIYNRLNGVMEIHSKTKMRKDILQRLHSIVSKLGLCFGGEPQVVRKNEVRRMETAHIRFLQGEVKKRLHNEK